jgi:hypothetical protein
MNETKSLGPKALSGTTRLAFTEEVPIVYFLAKKRFTNMHSQMRIWNEVNRSFGKVSSQTAAVFFGEEVWEQGERLKLKLKAA